MSENTPKSNFPLPPNTPAIICANCGAVSLYASGVCNPQGKGTKADWCGTESIDHRKLSFCTNDVNNERYQCRKCGQISVTPELLCEPEKMVK